MTAPASGDKAAKTRGELLTGPVFPMVVKFGVPTMVSMLTPAIYNLTGAYFVSTLGTTAVAALGIVFSLHMILAAVGIMTGQGCASQTSRLLGAGEYEAAGFIAGMRAPFDGTVVMLVKREGDLVTPGAPIVMMESAGAPVFETYVPESFAPGVREGMAVRIELKGRAPLAGAVERVVHSADQLTRTCLVKIAFSGDAADVMPGTFGTAVFELAGTSEVRVAASALTKRAGLEGVFVVRDGEAKFRWLRLGERRGDFVTVLAGLEGGEVVVDSPRATLNEGSPVRIADRQN